MLQHTKNTLSYSPVVIRFCALQVAVFLCVPFSHQTLKVFGDDDPIDVVEIGSTALVSGSVTPVKALGVLAMIDDGELDWKVVAIAASDPMASELNDVADIEAKMPGTLSGIREWFRWYKVRHQRFGQVFVCVWIVCLHSPVWMHGLTRYSFNMLTFDVSAFAAMYFVPCVLRLDPGRQAAQRVRLRRGVPQRGQGQGSDHGDPRVVEGPPSGLHRRRQAVAQVK